MSLSVVTGATSSIGKYLVDMLLASGEDVRILTRTCRESRHEQLEVVRGDLRNPEVVEQFLADADSVYHCAAEFHDQSTIRAINVDATAALIEAARKQSLKYFCYIGSAGVLGACNDAWVDESTPCHPRDLYEQSKYEAEQLVLDSGLEAKVCVLRPVFVVSPKRPGFLDYALHPSLINRLKVFFKGSERAHLVHAMDVAAAALHLSGVELEKPECYYIACDEDELNTVGGIVAYYDYLKQGESGEPEAPLSLPVFVPNLIRRIRRGPSLHGRTRFSSAKLRATGFEPPLGFRGAIRQIVGELES